MPNPKRSGKETSPEGSPDVVDSAREMLAWGTKPEQNDPVGAHGATEPSLGDYARAATVVSGTSIDQWIRGSAIDEWRAYGVGLRSALAAPPPFPIEVWLVGAGGLALLGLTRFALVGRTLSCARAAPEGVNRMASVAARLVGLPFVPRVLMTSANISPMVVVLPTPRIVLPETLWSQLDREGRLAVLVHESAHLRRRDHWVCVVEAIVAALYWWHPVAWWARKKLRNEADECCDAWVTMLMPRSRRAYAEALVMARGFSGPAPTGGLCLAMASSHAKRLARRLTMVMTSSRKPRLTAMGASLAVLVASVGTFITPTLACPPDKKEPNREGKKATIVAVQAPPKADAAPTPPAAPAVAKPRGFVAETRAQVSSDDSTFDRYMEGRGGQPEHVQERLERIERRLEAITRHLEQMSRRGAQAGQAGPSELDRVVVANPGHVMVDVDDDESLALAYILPGGKLGSLSALMARQDVPVLVRPESSRLIVFATPEQHEAFRNFAVLIHPEGVRVETLEGEPAGVLVLDADEAEWEEEQECGERAAEREALRAEARSLRGAARGVRSQAQNYESQARQVRRQVDQVHRESERTYDRAEQREERAEHFREKAEAYKEKAYDTGSQEKREQYLAKAQEYLASAELLMAEAKALHEQAEALHMRAEELEYQAEEMAEVAEDLEEEAEELNEEADELDEEADEDDDDDDWDADEDEEEEASFDE